MNSEEKNEAYNINEELKSDMWLLIIMAATLVSAVVIYGRLPDRIPLHWGASGQVDAYGSRSSIFLIPVTNIALYVLMLVIPLTDPRRENYGKFKGAYRVIRAITIIVLTVAYAAVVLSSLGYEVDVSFIIPFSVSILFIVLGNYMGKIRWNYFVGIRTPWTLADENVWIKTHRVGGWMFILAGILMMVSSFAGGILVSTGVIIVIVAVTSVPIIYSYVLYARTHKEQNPGN